MAFTTTIFPGMNREICNDSKRFVLISFYQAISSTSVWDFASSSLYIFYLSYYKYKYIILYIIVAPGAFWHVGLVAQPDGRASRAQCY